MDFRDLAALDPQVAFLLEDADRQHKKAKKSQGERPRD